MKLATLFRDSYAELKHVRTITTAAMFAASSVVLGMFTIQAVSYTHLDVYKRQGLRDPVPGGRPPGGQGEGVAV